jgi:hypothetical protein
MKEKKRFRPASVATGGNATYFISWNLEEASPTLRVQQEEGDRWVDITDKTVTVIVGKKMRLRGVVIPEKKDPKKGTWTIDGKGNHLNSDGRSYIKRYDVHFRRGGKVIYLKKKDLNKQEVAFYWIDGGSGKVKYATHVDTEDLAAEAKFEIKRPKYQLTVRASSGTSVKNPSRGGKLDKNECWGKGAHGVVNKNDLVLQYDGIHFKAENLDKSEIGGTEQWVQIIKEEPYFQKWDDGNRTCSYITDALDVCYPYEHGPQTQDAPGVVLERAGKRLKAKHKTGGTSTELAATGKTQTNRMFLMFKPDGDDSEWVPIKVVDWEWTGKAEYQGKHGWEKFGCKITPAEPKGGDTAEYPEWEKNAADDSKYSDTCQ